MKKKIFIIAEIGINHEGNLNKCLNLIKKAKFAGADAVKLQTINPENNYVFKSKSFKIFNKFSTLVNIFSVRTFGNIRHFFN